LLIVTVQKERITETAVSMHYNETELEEIDKNKGYHGIKFFASVSEVVT